MLQSKQPLTEYKVDHPFKPASVGVPPVKGSCTIYSCVSSHASENNYFQRLGSTCVMTIKSAEERFHA